jgi:type III secretion system YscD/HrpQ family protein
MSQRYLLIVDHGFNAGGSCSLDAKKTYFIGSADQCDIVLSDPDIAPQHAALTITDEGVCWRSVQGIIAQQKKELKQGDFAIWPIEAEVTVASTVIRIEPKKRWSANKTRTTNTEKPENSAKSNLEPEKALLPQQIKKAGIGAALLTGIICCFLYFNPYFISNAANQSAQVDSSQTPEGKLKAILSETKEGQLNLSYIEGKAVVTGYLNTRAELIKLKDRIRLDRPTASLQISTGEDLSTSVQDVMRMHGIIVGTVYEGDGVVKVEGLKDSGQKFQSAVRASLENINGLKRIAVGETDFQASQKLPNQTAEPAKQDNSFITGSPNDPKRVTALVAGEAPFVLTADGARYFEGALLPLGHKLLEIREKEIVVERDGQNHVVTF